MLVTISESLETLTQLVTQLTIVQARQINKVRKIVVALIIGLIFSLILGGVTSFLVVSGYNQQKQLDKTTRQLDYFTKFNVLLFYNACTLQNANAIRQNKIIDEAIAKELKRTKPDFAQINSLAASKFGLLTCGTEPAD